MSLSDFPGKISVIMPAFNEEQVIYRSIQETIEALAGCDFEIIVVDDGSSDRTWLEAQRAAKENARVRTVCYELNGGKGKALRFGVCHSTGDVVAFLDADLDLHPRQLHSMYKVMEETGADVVIGSKRHPESRLDYPWHRKIISTVYFGLIKGLFGLSIHDTQTGIKLFRHVVLAEAFPRVQTLGYAYDLELLVAATRFGYRIAEAPVELTFHARQQGRIGGRAIVTMWLDTMRIFYRASFWKWLQPAKTTKLWILALGAGLVTASFGAASILTFLKLPPWMVDGFYYLTLKFMPHPWRNVLLIVTGTVVALISLVQLNKSLMRAFAHTDDGSLSGIWKKQHNE